MSGCLGFLLSFPFSQALHDSSCIHSSPLLPTFEPKNPYSNPRTVLRMKCGIPCTCWEDTDCGLYQPLCHSLCCSHPFSPGPSWFPVSLRRRQCAPRPGFLQMMLSPWARLILLILEALTKAPFVHKESYFQLLPLDRTSVPLFPCNYPTPLSFM